MVDVPAHEEILVLLQSRLPDGMGSHEVAAAMDRVAADTTRKAIARLWKQRLVQRGSDGTLTLTDKGMRAASELVVRLLNA
jgi:Mn-dependent DtxR family transcriptional regulator